MTAKRRKQRNAQGSGAGKAAKPPHPVEPIEKADTTDDDARIDAVPNRAVPVVGVGASAGGLDAFKKFFAALSPDSGAAFVLIPHLDPKHESLMVELLARHTKMPVTEAKDGMGVEANHVYIIPPNKYMTILGGVLQLTGPVDRTSSQTSIDLFLRSLADDQQDHAICIILSGTGAHGTLGLKAVKAAGGMAMVQDPATAEYPRMPQNAIATGLADYVLPAEEMPKALVRYVQHFPGDGGVQAAGVDAPDHLNAVLALLRTRTKFDFRCYRKKMLTRRIERRMRLNHFDRLDAYVAHLREHPQEVKQLTRDLLISVTNFFRDPEALAVLADDVIAPLVQSKEPDAVIRVWVPGCATGEEAYTLAMIIFGECAKAHKPCRLQLFATDVDEEALEVARAGVYPESISTDVSLARLKHFFTKADEGHYQIHKSVRESVIFAVQNLIADAPFSKVDLVSCRNTLIYLEPEVQKKVLALLHFALNDGGHLLLGPSETIGRHTDLFEQVSKKWRIFRRIGPTRPDRVEFPISTTPEIPIPRRRSVEPTGGRSVKFAELTQRLLMEELAPAAVLINRKYEVLYFLGTVTRYLDVPSGEPTQDILAMAREGLRTKLRGAIHKAIEEGQRFQLGDLQVRRNGGYQRIAVVICPVLGVKDAEGLLLVVFQDVLESTSGEHPAEAAEGSLVRQLEYELRATKEDLQSTIEEMESANEELKASNEEVMSMNEELQSANEELETSKEELQSLNEELTTVNHQLEDNIEQLEQTNNDMDNLLNCTDIGTVFLDVELRIRRFTPVTTGVLNIVPTDVGRPITEIKLKFDDPDLVADVAHVLQRLTPREKDVRIHDGRWCLRRIVPYRTQDNRIMGAVITFADVTQLKAASAQSDLLAAVMRNSRDAVIVHNLGGKITHWNRGAELLYGRPENDAVGMSIQQIVPHALRKEYDEKLERIKRGERIDSWETQRLAKDGKAIDVWITATALTDEAGRPIAIAKIDRDITERKQAQAQLEKEVERRTAALHESEIRLRAILNAPDDAIITIDQGGVIESVNPAAESMFGYRAAEMIGKNGNFLMAPYRDEREGYFKRYLEAGNANNHGTAREVMARRKDGFLFWVDLSISKMEDLKRYTVILRDITRRKELESEVVEIATLEQRRIGQDLHDECGQELTALGLMAETLKERMPGEGDVLRRIRVGINSVLRQVRDIAHGLAVRQVTGSNLPETLRDLADRLTESSGIRCTFEMSTPVRLDDDGHATHLYHIAQEACTNALKHAKPHKIAVRLIAEDGATLLQIVDDGIGVGDDVKDGLGLRIMRHRAAVIGAAFSVKRAKPAGTVVNCSLGKEYHHGRK